MVESHPPLSWASSNEAHPSVSSTLPDQVITCLQNARFLHLATSHQNRPHVSLMNYTYLPSSPYSNPSGPLIIMTTNPSSKKTLNLLQNPHVSLLVHDWVTPRPAEGRRDRSPVGAGRSSSLATMLMQMNSAAVSSISATINGEAKVLDAGSEEERWCKEQHLINNTFETNGARQDSEMMLGTSPAHQRGSLHGDGGRGSYIEDDDVRVVVVRIPRRGESATGRARSKTGSLRTRSRRRWRARRPW